MKINQDRVPSNFEEAVKDIINGLSEDDKKDIRKIPYESAHFGLGMYLRNNWSLWEKDSILVQWFVDNFGLIHADDTSSLILDAVWADVNKEPRKTKELIERFKKHWFDYGLDAATMKKL